MVASAVPRKALTSKQEAFARLVANGKAYTDAYRIAYESKMAPGAVKVEAYRLAINPLVEEKISELKREIDERMVLSRSRKRHILFEIAEKKSNKPGDRVKAIEVDNRMTGDEAPVKVEGELTLGLVLTSVKQVKPITEHVQEPDTMTLQEEPSGMATPDESVRPTAVPPALPFDSGPFADQVAVLPPTAEQTPVKLTRTRSYDE